MMKADGAPCSKRPISVPLFSTACGIDSRPDPVWAGPRVLLAVDIVLSSHVKTGVINLEHMALADLLGKLVPAIDDRLGGRRRVALPG